MDYSFFDDAFHAITAARARPGTLSHPGPGNTNSEVPVPEDFGKILPDGLTPAQSSSSPTCTTPTTPSSSVFSDSSAGSTLSATPSPDEDVLMEDFIPTSHPLSKVLPVCASPPPPVASSPAPAAAAAQSSSQVPTLSTAPPTPGSPSVLTPTSSRSSPKPTVSASPEDHIEVKDNLSASGMRKGHEHYRCLCGNMFKRRCDLTKHRRSYNRVHPCPFQECEYHTKKWPTLKDLQRHLNSKHISSERHILCGIDGCTKTKPRKDNMQDHLKRKHFKTQPELVPAMMAVIMEAHAKRIWQLGDAANE